MRLLVVALTLPTLLGCARPGRAYQMGGATSLREGTYDFFASMPGQHLRGTVRILTDTVLVDTEGATCIPSVRPKLQTNRNVFLYGCTGGAMLTFDRNNPVQRSRWSTNVPVRRRQQVCTQTEVRDGREVCRRRAVETYEAVEPRSGAVQVVRRTAP